MKWTVKYNDTYDRHGAARFIELMSDDDPYIKERFGKITKVKVGKSWSLKNLKSFKDKTDWVFITMEGTKEQKEEVMDWLLYLMNNI